MAVSIGLPPTAEKRISSPEAIRAREAAGHEPAGASGSEPGRKVGFGADASVETKSAHEFAVFRKIFQMRMLRFIGMAAET
jgi:hypothetical protein